MSLAVVVGACAPRWTDSDVASATEDAGADGARPSVAAPAQPAPPRTREAPPGDASLFAPPVCAPGPAAADVASHRPTESSDYVHAEQSFVAAASGYLTAIELSLRRCEGAPDDRVVLRLTDPATQNVIAHASAAYIALDCSNLPSLDGQPGVMFDLASDCARVVAGKRYEFALQTSGSASDQKTPRFRFGYCAADDFVKGTCGGWPDDTSRPFGDLVFKTYVAP